MLGSSRRLYLSNLPIGPNEYGNPETKWHLSPIFLFLIRQGVFVTLLSFVVGMPTAFAADRIENFAGELAKLRKDVQSLSTQIEDYEAKIQECACVL